jgi:hypothetical protein
VDQGHVEHGLARHGLNNFEQFSIMCVVIVAFISLIYAWLLRGTVLKKDKGTAKMQEVWNAIRIGANSYLSRQLKTILPAIAALAVVLFFSVYIVPVSREALAEFPNNTTMIIAIGRTLAFIVGVPLIGFLIARAGWLAPFPLMLVLGVFIFVGIFSMLPKDDLSATAARSRDNFRLVLTCLPALTGLAIGLFASAANEQVNLIFGVWLEDSFGLKIAALGTASAIIGISE